MDWLDFCLFCQICISGFLKYLFKAIVKQNLVQPILSAVFPILCDASAEEEADDEDEEEVVAKTPSSVAAQVRLHSLAFFMLHSLCLIYIFCIYVIKFIYLDIYIAPPFYLS